MILFAIVLVIVIIAIISFFAFAGNKKKEGDDVGEHETNRG